jgi:copper homeostasis protein
LTRFCLLEVIACSVEDAVAAEAGGADRLEIISHYEVGGLTPPLEMVKEIAARVKIPLRVMARESEPFEVQDKREIERLFEAARAFAKLRVEGLVLGFLQPGENAINHDLLARVLAAAPNLKATFHRAIEELPDHQSAIAELKRHAQIDRILTSGGSGDWADKVERFAVWQRLAQPELEILVGGGTDAEVISLLKPAGIREFHVGKAVREGQSIDGVVLAERVRELKSWIEQW